MGGNMFPVSQSKTSPNMSTIALSKSWQHLQASLAAALWSCFSVHARDCHIWMDLSTSPLFDFAFRAQLLMGIGQMLGAEIQSWPSLE